MLNRVSFRLEAHSDRLNHHRLYVVEIGQDLFGAHTVDVGFGRAGAWQRVQRFAFAAPQEAARLVAVRLRRRATARKRIGCPYRLVGAATGAPESPNYALDLSAFRDLPR
jgi:hypothetical protein